LFFSDVLFVSLGAKQATKHVELSWMNETRERRKKSPLKLRHDGDQRQQVKNL
jgi:hypothetical protein